MCVSVFKKLLHQTPEAFHKYATTEYATTERNISHLAGILSLKSFAITSGSVLRGSISGLPAHICQHTQKNKNVGINQHIKYAKTENPPCSCIYTAGLRTVSKK